MKIRKKSRLNCTGIHPFGVTSVVNADRLLRVFSPTFGAEKFGIVGNVYWGTIPALGVKSVNEGEKRPFVAIFPV
jgi:hypothetical protein